MVLDPQNLLTKWGDFAPWVIFALALLAGLNVPISIDILLTLSALIAAHYLPEKLILLFSLFTIGCILSAWISYSLGRFFGRFIPSERRAKISAFYAKFGCITFFICRFIPFGVRNLFFMSSGASKVSFYKFALFDAMACTLWSSLFFFSIYHLGQNFDSVLTLLKHLNIAIFAVFITIALTLFFFYKHRKKQDTRVSSGENSKDLL